MGIFRVLLVLVMLFSGYVATAHACVDIAPITNCCDEAPCSGCVAPAAVVAAMIFFPVAPKPALEATPVQELAQEAPPLHLRPPDGLA